MPLPWEERLEMGYSRSLAGINLSNGPQGNMTPLRRIQRTEEEGEEVTSIYPTRDEGGSTQISWYVMTPETWDHIKDFWNNGPLLMAETPGWPSSTPPVTSYSPKDTELVNPQAAPTTPWETTPVPLEPQVIDYQIPSQDTEQTITMQLVSTGQEDQDGIVPTPSRTPNQEGRESTVPLGWNMSMDRANWDAPVDDTGQPAFQVPLSDVLTGQPHEEPSTSRVPLFPPESTQDPHFSWLA